MTERPQFAPSAAGARDVLARARARRRRQALVTTGGVTVAAAVIGLLVAVPGAGAGPDRLNVVPGSPAPHAVPSTAAAGRHQLPPSRPAVTSSDGRGGAGPATGPGSGGGSGPSGRGFGGPQPADPPTPYTPSPRHSASAPISRTTVGSNAACDDPTNANVVDSQGWCLVYTGPTTARRKHPVTLSVELCRPSVYGDGTIHFDDARQIDVSLQSGAGSAVWHAGQGISYPRKASAAVVRAGTCLRWSAVWDTIAPDGFYAPPDSYSVSLGLDSSDVGGYAGDTVTLTD